MTPDRLQALLCSPAVARAAQAHAIEVYPEESCGVIDGEGVYHASKNMAPDPREAFALDPRVVVFHTPIAIVHSHTADQMRGPSATDMASQIEGRIPWGIVWTNGVRCRGPIFWGDDLPVPPQIGRSFRHGPAGTDGRGDCYATIRDEMLIAHGIRIPEFPRDDAWWDHGENLYVDGFERAGFRRIPRVDLQPGDVLLMSVQYNYIHHGGIITREHRLLHHLGGRLSAREALQPWLPVAKLIVRHQSLMENR